MNYYDRSSMTFLKFNNVTINKKRQNIALDRAFTKEIMNLQNFDIIRFFS